MNREMSDRRRVGDPGMDVPPIEANPDDGIHRVLVVADEIFRGNDFLDELRSHMKIPEAEVEIFVVTPALAESAFHHEMADVDGPIKEAGHRLDTILRELKVNGIKAIGHVGDSDPVTAVGDGLREFPADELIMVSHPDSQLAYAEKNLWDRLRLDFRLPISAIEVPRPEEGGLAAGAIRVQHEPAKEHTEEEVIRATRNFPPLTRQDAAGIIVGLLGTFFLGVIAVLSNLDAEGPIHGRGAATILIAIASFLLNVGHTVGLLFFQSIRYTGIWDRFMARLALGFTTVGLIASLLLWLA